MNIMIRADANAKIGAGHAMRCLALAQAWRDRGGDVFFCTTDEYPDVISRFRAEGAKFTPLFSEPGSEEDAYETVKLAGKIGASWIITDGYQFGADYQKAIKDAGFPLLFIDDHGHSRHYFADIVLNQNIYANEALYKNSESYTQLLLGTQYTMLRREFLRWSGWRRMTPDVVKKVLVTLGGGDFEYVIREIIRLFERVKKFKLTIEILLGGAKPYSEALRSVAQASSHDIHLERYVAEMPQRMVWADFAVSAAGGTLWELAYLGCPTGIVILSENHLLNADLLQKSGVSENFGPPGDIDNEKRAKSLNSLIADGRRLREMTCSARKMVDGQGAARVINMLC